MASNQESGQVALLQFNTFQFISILITLLGTAIGCTVFLLTAIYDRPTVTQVQSIITTTVQNELQRGIGTVTGDIRKLDNKFDSLKLMTVQIHQKVNEIAKKTPGVEILELISLRKSLKETKVLLAQKDGDLQKLSKENQKLKDENTNLELAFNQSDSLLQKVNSAFISLQEVVPAPDEIHGNERELVATVYYWMATQTPEGFGNLESRTTAANNYINLYMLNSDLKRDVQKFNEMLQLTKSVRTTSKD